MEQHVFIGVCGKSKQAETNPGHPAAQPGKTGRIPDEVPHGPSGGRTIQRREGVSD